MPHTLVLRYNGTAELLDSEEETLWASDSDDDFKDEVSAEFLTQGDVLDILDYLVDQDLLTDEQANQCVIEEESMPSSEAAEVEPDLGHDVE